MVRGKSSKVSRGKATKLYKYRDEVCALIRELDLSNGNTFMFSETPDEYTFEAHQNMRTEKVIEGERPTSNKLGQSRNSNVKEWTIQESCVEHVQNEYMDE